jgi:hypothetical protein
MAEFRAIRSDSERMLHLRARIFAPLTILNLPLLGLSCSACVWCQYRSAIATP